DGDTRLELLRYQAQELEALRLRPGEIEALGEERARLANRGRLAAGAHTALAELYENEGASAHAAVSRALQALRGLTALDGQLARLLPMLEEASIQVREAAREPRSSPQDACAPRASSPATSPRACRRSACRAGASKPTSPRTATPIRPSTGSTASSSASPPTRDSRPGRSPRSPREASSRGCRSRCRYRARRRRRAAWYSTRWTPASAARPPRSGGGSGARSAGVDGYYA